MKTMKKLLAIILVLTTVLSFVACGTPETENSAQNGQGAVQNTAGEYIGDGEEGSADLPGGEEGDPDDEGIIENPDDSEDQAENVIPNGNLGAVAPIGDYNEGVVLIKVYDTFSEEDLGTLEYTSVEPVHNRANWFRVYLTDPSKTQEAVLYLSALGFFEGVDYDYADAAN